jgi:hypothetical protein
VAPVHHLLPCKLARPSGLTQKTSAPWWSAVKVTEHQARGVIHFHAVIRLDAAVEDYQPPGRFTADLLADAIRQAAAAVAVMVAPDDDRPIAQPWC